MTSSHHLRRRRMGPWGSLPAVVAVVGLLLMAVAAAPSVGVAQESSQDVVSERELEYRSARGAYQAALDARAAAERRFERALQEIRAAQEEGDEGRLRRAYAQAQDQALQLQSLEQRVRETSERVDRVRGALVAALDARVEALVAELGETRNRIRRQELGALVRNLTFRIREVEEEGDLTGETHLAALPEVAWDPRDGVQELNWKADLLERRARQYAERIDEIDSQMEDLRRRQRRNRSLNDLLTGIQRFDDDQVPVVSPSDDAETRSGSVEQNQEEETDTASAGSQEMTLEDRIESLELLRTRIEDFRDEVLFRARQFRNRAEEISS